MPENELNNPISRADAAAALDLAIMVMALGYAYPEVRAVVDAGTGSSWFRELSNRLIEDGAVDERGSTGDLVVGLGDLIQRLRWSLDAPAGVEPPSAMPRLGYHLLRFATEAAARLCLIEVLALGGGVRSEVTMDPAGLWEIYAVGAEFPPDDDFVRRGERLEALAAEQGGGLVGSGLWGGT